MDQLVLQIMDGGPLYKEFVEEGYIKEPWNAWSSLLFFTPVIYWGWKLRSEFKTRGFLYILLLFLFLNGLGSTLYHAFRSEPFFMYLDFVPAIAFTFLLAVFLWKKIFDNWWKSLLIILFLNSFRFLVWNIEMNQQTSININYFITGLTFIVPALLVLWMTRFRYSKMVLFSAFFIALSLFFRVIDKWELFALPMGTHFLWHVFNVASVFPLFSYLYKIQHHPLKKIAFKKNKDL